MTRVGTIRVAIRRDDILRYQGDPPRTAHDVAHLPNFRIEDREPLRRNAMWVAELPDPELARSMVNVIECLLRVGVPRTDIEWRHDR